MKEKKAKENKAYEVGTKRALAGLQAFCNYVTHVETITTRGQ